MQLPIYIYIYTYFYLARWWQSNTFRNPFGAESRHLSIPIAVVDCGNSTDQATRVKWHLRANYMIANICLKQSKTWIWSARKLPKIISKIWHVYNWVPVSWAMGIKLTHSWNNCSNFLNLKCWHNDAGCTCLHLVYGYPFAEMCEEQVFRAESLSLTGQFLSEPAPLQTKRDSQQSGLHWKAILGGLSVEPDPIFPRIRIWYRYQYIQSTKLIADAFPYRGC